KTKKGICMDKHLDADKLAACGPLLQSVVGNGDLSGVVAAVWRKGEIARLDMVGKRDIGKGPAMGGGTLFRIASVTKPITSVAAMMLVEEGKMALSDPITRWMPEFKDMKVLKRADGPLDETYPAPRDITVDDLFTHRSGLAYGFTSAGPIGKAHAEAL